MNNGGVNLAPRLKRALRAKKITQAELAERVDVQPSTVSAWINGHAKPHLDVLERVAKELGTTVSALVGGAA